MEHESPKIWEERISHWQVSGLTIRDWCQQHEVDMKQFYIWRNKIQKKNSDKEQPVFAELRPALPGCDSRGGNPSSEKDSRLTLCYQGWELYIPEIFNPDTLFSLLRTLQRL